MNIFIRILIGIGIVVFGAYTVIRTRNVLEFFGPIEWAENKIGPGGSNLMFKLIGIFVCFIGFMVATNLWGSFVQGTIGSFIP